MELGKGKIEDNGKSFCFKQECGGGVLSIYIQRRFAFTEASAIQQSIQRMKSTSTRAIAALKKRLEKIFGNDITLLKFKPGQTVPEAWAA